MKKTGIKVAAFCSAALLALTACGGGAGSSSNNASSNSAAGTVSADAEVIHIGGIGPLTGPAALYGNAVKNGAQLAVDEINAANSDLQIVFQMEDDEHDAEKSVNAYNKLLDDGMQMLMGTVTTAPCTAVAAKAYEDRVFALTPSASGPSVTQGNDNVYQLCFSDPNQGVAAADYIAKNYSDSTVGIIYNNGDNYSTGITDKFTSQMKANGMEVAASEAFPSDDNVDFTAQLNAMKSAGVNLIFLPIYYTPASNIMTQAKNMAYDVTYFGVDGMDGILDLEGFDTSLAEGVLLLTPFTPYSEDAKVKSFVEAYESQFGEKPIQFAADAYDCIYALYDAFKQSGCAVTDDSATICEALISVFNGSFQFDGGLTGDNMKWSSEGEVNKTPKVCEIQDGKYIEK